MFKMYIFWCTQVDFLKDSVTDFLSFFSILFCSFLESLVSLYVAALPVKLQISVSSLLI